TATRRSTSGPSAPTARSSGCATTRTRRSTSRRRRANARSPPDSRGARAGGSAGRRRAYPPAMSAAAPQWATATDMAAVLDLEPIDRDLFRAVNTVAELRTTLYGGQVAAQALRAAALTVDADRYPHSLHGYFLRPGRFDLPVILH